MAKPDITPKNILMNNLIEKFYTLLFSEDQKTDDVPYAHKLLIFRITLLISVIVLFFMIRFIVKNMENITLEGVS